MSDSPHDSDARAMQLQPFACDGQVGEEKLVELLAAGAEFPSLDFKRELDLGSKGKKMDFIKDCAAMMNLPRGGYLVVGAEDDGTPAIGIDPPTKEMFDSGRLAQTVKGYVDAAVDIRAQVHTIMIRGQSACMAVIYIGPPADGIPAIMSKDGVSKSPSNGAPIIHFRVGSVYTREGTTNALVRHQTWAQILENFRDQERVAARADVDSLIRRVVQMMGTGTNPVSIIPDLAMDPSTFTEAIHTVLDAQNHSALKRFLVTAKGSYRGSDNDEGRILALNRIAAVAAEAVIVKDLKAIEQASDTLFELYKSYLIEPTQTAGRAGAEARWLEITLRIMAIGAAAVREDMYEAIPTLVLRKIGDDTYSYRSWIRHGLTMASRVNLFADVQGTSRGGGIIALSSEIMLEYQELRPDILDADKNSLNEASLDSLCQFDFIWCCLSLASDDRQLSASFYPSCSAYHQDRVMPAAQRLDNDEDARQAVFGDLPDKVIASSIYAVLEYAQGQSWNYGGFWRGVSDLAPEGYTMTQSSKDKPR
ncbi:helix-turn-helix domain-containing protein [Arthrobacter sp. 3Tela_A]|uniref:AlbA family DNA-binding domain-containing protein n=1 Tax=Arthrobacter sp. 3Tela_A TaxID=3093743 RepID=UPI003BB569FD